ncbi:iron ABC transporter permease [Peptostreptococcus canis]|uniref:Probable heme-iron transport system permease protein IsdF n=2 Tax=Peptostreptococcus canis TaxID=1159213 RepID=A0ABR6TIU6_9FIRM|nr:iron ABC transporter permease [Peptostreptococcus canis]MBC2575341.1 iron ABC transporter permease [Peptostreptococcus canis]
MIFSVTILLLIIIFFFSVKAGSLKVSFGQLIHGLFIQRNPDVATIWDLRFPRVIIAMLAGAGISVSGALLQAVMKNPLTDPGIIGISSAASLAAVLIATFVPALYFSIPFFAVLGGLGAYLLIYSLAWDGGVNPVKLVLVGVALNMTFVGLGEFFKAAGGQGSNLSKVQSIIEGNIAQKTWADVNMLFWYVIIGLIVAMLLSKKCNILSLEDKTARGLGVNVDRDRFIVALVGIVIVSISTATVGVIGFLGLIVPHIAKLLVGSDHRIKLPYTMVLGALVLLISDTVGRLIFAPYEIPAAIIMAVIGGPFFIFLLRRGGDSFGS